VSVNYGQIAEQSDLTVESVYSILAGVRDEIVNQVILKQGNAQLNFGFGTLYLRKGSLVEFKSYDQNEPSHKIKE
jgi:hypothetical protein